MPSYQDKVKAFWEYVKIGKPNECWLWHGPLESDKGHDNRTGSFWFNKKKMLSYQVAYLIDRAEEAPPRLTHSCRNRLCCNPRHIVVKEKRKQRKLEQIAWKLSEEKAKLVRRLWRQGASQIELAYMFNVCQPTIKQIVHNETYQNTRYVPHKQKTYRMTRKDIGKAKKLLASGMSQAKVGRIFGVSQGTISQKVRG